MAFPKKKKIIDGKIYSFYEAFSYKDDLNRTKQRLMKKGVSVRVIPRSDRFEGTTHKYYSLFQRVKK